MRGWRRGLVAGAVALGAWLVPTMPVGTAVAQPAPPIVTVAAGTTVPSGTTFMVSGYSLVMQPDGNLVLSYFANPPLPALPIWESGTFGHPGAFAVMQTDGNFVVETSPGGPALWTTGTAGYPGASFAL